MVKDFPTLTKNTKTSVLVVGGGICGILCAYFLVKEGLDVILLESDKICNKKTLKTTAVITALEDVMYADLLNDFGREKTKLFLEAKLFALNEYRKLSKKFDFDFEECSSFKYDTSGKEILKKEYDVLLGLGYQSFLSDKINFPIKVSSALEFKNQGQMNPIKLVNELAKYLTIYENSRVVKIKGNIAYTSDYFIEFENVVVCTGFPFLKLKGLFPLKMHQEKSHVVAIKENKNIKGNGIGISDNDIYYRNYKDYLLVGANDMQTGCDYPGFENINKFLVDNFNIKNISYRWINEDTVTLDGVPYIGRYSSGSQNMYVATGFNLWGMTSSMISAHLISDLIMGRKNKYEELFSPSRKAPIKPLLANIKTAVTNLLLFKKRRCTHLGCALHYNSIDDTYECKCHGSKYDSNGNIIESPAQKGATI